jgi:hypothetical protein
MTGVCWRRSTPRWRITGILRTIEQAEAARQIAAQGGR